MKTPGILYLHGFCSSPASWKSRRLAEAMTAAGLGERFACPALSPDPAAAMAAVSASLEALGGRDITLVGSSLGGHYATWLADVFGLRAVLINPAVVDCLDLSRFAGEHANFHTGERFLFTAEHGEALRRQVVRPAVDRIWLLVETGDEVLDYRAACDYYAGCRQTVLPGGDHSFTRFPEFIPQILEFAGLSAKL